MGPRSLCWEHTDTIFKHAARGVDAARNEPNPLALAYVADIDDDGIGIIQTRDQVRRLDFFDPVSGPFDHIGGGCFQLRHGVTPAMSLCAFTWAPAVKLTPHKP